MAGVFGSKVREPKLIRRSGLHLDEQTPYATDLAQAWTSFGEAKTVLQRLEQASGSPPVKDRTTRRTKPHHVHFDSQRGSRGERLTQQHGYTTASFANGQSFENVPGSDGREGKENEYIVEPKALNELGTRGSGEFETRGTSSDGAYVTKTSPLRDGSGKATSASYRPGRSQSATHTLTGKVPTEQPASQRYDSSVRFTVPPSSSSLHPSPPSHSYAHTHTTTTTTTSHRHHITTASPSNPNSAGSSYPRPATTAAPYSNRAAVFGPPVRFGEDARQPTMVQPVDSSSRTYSAPLHHRVHTTSSSATAKPRSSTAASQTSTSRVPSGSAVRSTTVPIRTFELPQETLGTLRSKIELQKQAKRELSSKTDHLGTRSSTTREFYPLPDASTTATSSFASSSSVRNGPRVPHPPPTSHSHDPVGAAKRRKVASAPPPQTYTGFSSTRTGTKSGHTGGAGGVSSSVTNTKSTTMSWKPNLETLGVVGGVGGARGVALPSSLTSSGGVGGARFSSQATSDTLQPPKRSHHVTSKRVRKVQRIPDTGGSAGAPLLSSTASYGGAREAWGASNKGSSRPGAPASGLITTSSWRVGKELTDKILKSGRDRESGPGRQDYRSRREERSPQYSTASESLSHLSSSQENISVVSSSVDVQMQPERGGVDEVGLHGSVSPAWRGGTKTEREGAGGRGRLAVDVAGLLEDLDSSASPVRGAATTGERGGGGGEGRERGRTRETERERAQLGRTRSTSGGPASKKPQYNTEPTYPTERVRHYDQTEVKSYMQRKQEGRRKKELEERLTREKMTKERDEKLKQLYESQRKRVEANLRLKQKQREAYSKALASSTVHIHLHGGSATSSTSSITADPPAPMPTLNLVPPTPVSSSPAVGSLTLHVHTGSATSPLLSPPRRSPPSKRTSPAPLSYSPMPPHISPPRYSRLGTSPTSRKNSRSPSISPRTYSIPSSTSSSPKVYQSPQRASEHAQLRHQSPSAAATVTVTTERAQYGLPTEHARYGVPTERAQYSVPTEHAQYGVPLLSGQQSREERIRALTQSALRLKERIAMESKKFEEGNFGTGVETRQQFSVYQRQHSSPARATFSVYQRQHSSPARATFFHDSNQQGFTHSVDLPGVRNVHEHALQAERQRREADAATKIQAAYRGHRVRKSMNWTLPSGQTLGASLRRGLTRGVDEERESRSSSGGTLTPAEEEEEIDKNKEEMSTPVISPLHGQRQENFTSRPSIPVPSFRPVPPATTAGPRLPPWQGTGGDEHSVINVFARQHERLRQTLDQLRDQKRAEIRGFSEERKTTSETPKNSLSSSGHVPRPQTSSVSHSYSYTQTFEQTSPSNSATGHSPHSSIFSEDSLHISSPKHGGPSSKTSLSPTLSVHSQHTPPHTAISPPQAKAASTSAEGTTTRVSDGAASFHSSKGEPKSQQQQQHEQSVEETVHVITPPGSPSFVESFASISPRTQSSSHTTDQNTSKQSSKTESAHEPTTSHPRLPPGAQPTLLASVHPPSLDGRLSPRSLELKLHSELNLLETVEDSMRQLSQVESARAVSLAQQETVALAQLLKSRQHGHEQELEKVATKNEREMEDAHGKLDREAALMSEQRRRMEREHSEEMLRMREEASRVSHEATLRINEARTAASEAVIQAAKQQLEAAHDIAASAASAAAREAVKASLIATKQQKSPLQKQRGEREERVETTDGTVSASYESDFETDSLAGSDTRKDQPDLKPSPNSSPRSDISSATSSGTIEEEIEERTAESATPVAPPEEVMEVTHGDRTLVGDRSELEESYQSQSPIEELLEGAEGDISETSFRELLPSESHRRQQAKLSKEGQRRQRRRQSHSESEESHSRASSPSHDEGSRVPSPMPSELSPSPGAGEDSFFQFMGRMVRAYMHEEELRARHQATLLRLREDALQEKTKAHLEWLKVKKKALRKKGDDDQMPPLARMEKGLLKKFKQQQAEIHQLKEAQKAARRERRLMLQQQQEISQMRRSAQYYRNKIHQHSHRVTHSPSPSPSLQLLDEVHHGSHLLDESEVSVGDFSVAEELSESDEQKSLIAAPSEDLEQSSLKVYSEDFPSYSPSPEPVLTATIRTETVSDDKDRTLTESSLLSSQTPVKSKGKASLAAKKSPPGVNKSKSSKSPTSESHTVKELEKLAATDHHKFLSLREQRLFKRRKAAEKVLKQQQELLKKEQILDREEEQVNKLVNEALTCYQQRTKIKKDRTKERSRHSSSEEPASVKSPRSREMSATISSPVISVEEPGAKERCKKEQSRTKSSISEDIGASGSITEEISEVLLSRATSSQPLSGLSVRTATPPRGASDYTLDTFESFHSSTLSHHDHPPHPATSTPSHEFKKPPQAGDDLSISVTESLTSMTSDGSTLEERIRLLKQQLQQKKEEMKKYQNEQKRKKKAVLRQQEEELKRKLEMVESRAKQMKSASPLRSPGTATPLSSATSATSSQVHSERSESEQSRESTASPQPMAPLVTDPSLPRQSITGATPTIKPNQELITNEERSASPASVQEQLSPAVPQSYSYTPFSDSVTSGLAMPQVNGETIDELAHDETIVSDKGEQATPTVPEEQDTSRSTLVAEEEEEEEEREEGEGEEEREQQPGAVAASAERVEDEEDKPLEDISVKTGSISEHISEFSSEAEEEEEEEEVEVVGVNKTMSPLEMEAQDERGVSPSDQYSDSFEEPSSAPSSQAPPLGELTPPLEPLDEAAAAEDKPHPSDKGSEPAEQSEEEQVDVLDSLDGQADEEIDYQIGQRVLVGNKMTGTVRYVGHTHFAEGVWVGVEIDLPRGRNDGSIDGQKYFNCEQNYGLFAPPEKISLFEGEERAAEEEEEEGQPPFNEEEEVSSVVEDLEVEEQLSSEPEEGDGEEYGDEDRVHLEVDAPPQSPLPQRESPSPVDDGYSPDFESSYEEEEEEEESEMEERGEGEKDEEEREYGRLKNEEAVGQHKEEYQWPTSREGTHEPSPLDEESQTLDKEATPPTARKDQGDLEGDEKEEERKMQLPEMGKIVVQVTDEVPNEKSKEKTSQITEHPPPAKEMLETLGEKSESFPQAPEVANQRSQSATPTPAPPPEFAEGASKETSKEPPPPVLQVSGEIAPTLKQTSEVISEELAQELTNEAYETMHNIWKVKRELATKGEVSSEGETATILQGPLDKDVKLSLKDKADKVADQLLMVLLQSETNIARNIHNFKKSQKEEAQDAVEEILSPTSRMHSLQLPRSPIAKESERPVLSPVPEEAPDDDQDEGEEKKVVLEEETVTPLLSPTRRGSPAKLTLTGMGNVIESSPPPLSPPSPYRLSPFVPSFTPAADEFSPPGSPPKHLSQASAARVAAGDKTPFMSSQDKERKSMERSTSSESITSLLDSLKIKTAQCMVPSERTNINEVVKRSWEVCEEIGFDRIHGHSPCCPSEVLDMFSDLHELSPEESHCRKAYLELVFNLTVETLQSLHCASEDSPIWTHESAVRALLAPEHKNGGKVTVEKVQKKVYKALMRGQLPSQLPAVKFLRGMKRPGGREIDFVDTILIKELREEEPGWIDYCGDEASVKMKTADAILDSLITETVQIMSEISRNRVSRQSTQS